MQFRRFGSGLRTRDPCQAGVDVKNSSQIWLATVSLVVATCSASSAMAAGSFDEYVNERKDAIVAERLHGLKGARADADRISGSRQVETGSIAASTTALIDRTSASDLISI